MKIGRNGSGGKEGGRQKGQPVVMLAERELDVRRVLAHGVVDVGNPARALQRYTDHHHHRRRRRHYLTSAQACSIAGTPSQHASYEHVRWVDAAGREKCEEVRRGQENSHPRVVRKCLLFF